MDWKHEHIFLKYHWNLNISEKLQWVLHVNNVLELLLKYYVHTFMTSSILLRLKSRSTKGAPHHSAFIGSCPATSHLFLALATQWMSFPSRKWERGVGPRLHLIVFVWCESGEIGRRRGSRFLCHPSGGIFSLDRVALRIPSNIKDRVPVQKQPTALTC